MINAHLFDSIVSDRPLTHDLLGGLTRKWRVIYADPPWKFSNRSEKGEDRNANRYYDTMDLKDIMALPVADIAAEDSVLCLWVTDPTLNQGMRLLESWGFEYTTVLFYWAKTSKDADLDSLHHEKDLPMGTGYITRANPEMMLIGKRGDPSRRIHNIKGKLQADMSIRRLQFAPKGAHSEKPEKFARLIERLYDGPYLELFARKTRPGWGSWGNQVGGLEDGSAGGKRRLQQAPIPLFDQS